MKNRTFLIFFVISIIFLSVGCKNQDLQKTNEDINHKGEIRMNLEQLQKPKVGEEIGVIKTNYGEIRFRLFDDVAPKAVENFKTLARDGYYDGIIFHRVMNDFMIQGGDPTGTGRSGTSIWNDKFQDEFDPNYHNFRGALSMANSGPNTNGSQFFIVQSPSVGANMLKEMEEVGEKAGYSKEVAKAYKELGGTPWLDFKHTVFGQVFEGMDTVDKIANLKTNKNDKPLKDVIMEEVKIVEFKK